MQSQQPEIRPIAPFTDARSAFRSLSRADMEVAAMDNQLSATQQSDIDLLMGAIGQMQRSAAAEQVVSIPAHVLNQLIAKPKDYVTIWLLIGGVLCISVAAVAAVISAVQSSPSQQMIAENKALREENARLATMLNITANKAMKSRNCFGWCPGN